MKIVKSLFINFLFILFLISCATTKSSQSNNKPRIYNKDFTTVINATGKAVQQSKLILITGNELNDNEYEIIYGGKKTFSGDQAQKNQGTITIQKMSDGKVRVEVQNPEYPDMMIGSYKKDFKKIIYNHLNELLKPNSGSLSASEKQ